ncbi:MAG: hypothetical protein WAV30_02940 [Microgenomates group bacterium]
MNTHREKQIEIIQVIEEQVRADSLQATTVIPVADFENDDRICLTSVHFPAESFTDTVLQTITEPLRKLFPGTYCYPKESLHFTIKNIRVIANPPSFTEEDVQKAIHIFEQVVPQHTSFRICPYKLLVFKNNLALICTTDEELDRLILELDTKLSLSGIPDNKRYANSRYFFCNMTLMRFALPPPESFLEKVKELSDNLPVSEYTIDSVNLLTGNAAMKKLQVQGEWKLRG